VPTVPTIPRVGDVVKIGLGTVDNLEFGGRIVSIQHTREAARVPPFLQILCTDFLPDFDQRLVTWAWPRQSASLTILDLVAKFCQHNAAAPFTTTAVKPDLPTLEAFEVINARPSEIMRRVMTLCSGGFYVGPNRDLHAWADGAEPGYPDPAPLSLNLITLKAFAHLEDGAQARTAIVVEGPSTTAPIGIPADPTAAGLGNGIPIDDVSRFRGYTNFEARIGSQRVRVSYLSVAWDPALARDGEITADIIPTVDTWYPLTLADGGAFLQDIPAGSVAWGQIGERYCMLHHSGASNFYCYTSSTGNYAGVTMTIKAGARVTKKDAFFGVTGEASIATAASGTQPIRAQPAGCAVVGVLRQSITPAAGAWPPANVEHLISDGRLSFAGAAERAAIELENFAHVDLRCEWETDDPNARIGRHQAITLESPDALATTVVILTSEITFPVAGRAPRRHNTGGAVKRANILDILLTAKD
jgi:hypothetical protein